MNPILVLLVFLSGLFTTKDTPVDLRKKPTKEDYLKSLNCWIGKYFNIIAFAAIIFLLVTFIFVCFSLTGVSATESGALRNFLAGGV